MASIYDDLPDIPKGGLWGAGKKVRKHLRKKKVKGGLQGTAEGIGRALDDIRDKRIARRKRKKYKLKAQLAQRANR